jgi:hypothetical protein
MLLSLPNRIRTSIHSYDLEPTASTSAKLNPRVAASSGATSRTRTLLSESHCVHYEYTQRAFQCQGHTRNVCSDEPSVPSSVTLALRIPRASSRALRQHRNKSVKRLSFGRYQVSSHALGSEQARTGRVCDKASIALQGAEDGPVSDQLAILKSVRLSVAIYQRTTRTEERAKAQ